LTCGRKGNVAPKPDRGGDVSNWDKVEGEAKEQAGKLTDDEKMENEGRAQETWGDAKEKADDAKEKADDAKDELEERF
jgi:uncharacterized protein YjbJ (UPF0337 family)